MDSFLPSRKLVSEKNLKGTWNQALLAVLMPLVLVAGLRWAVVEPFVIPSGSMIPNLLVHDHLLVKKFAYGAHIPFSSRWLIRWGAPQAGDVVVFRYPENPDVYYIKRLIGLPGDKVSVTQGRIRVNDQEWTLTKDSAVGDDSGFEYFQESVPGRSATHRVRFYDTIQETEEQTFEVPPEQYFFMGDNRDQSSDGRSWGYVKQELLVGPASLIWLSCDQTLPTLSYVCDPAQIRWSRLFKILQ